MKLDDITPDRLQRSGDKELLNLHIRVHQLYSLAEARKNKEFMSKLFKLHSMIVEEMERREMKHNSPLNIKGVKNIKL